MPMKTETIEKEAKARCVTERMDEWKKNFGISCFMDGAEWRIKSVWHDTAETPQPGREFIYQSIRKGSLVVYYGIYTVNGEDDWNFVREFVVMERWAYIDDLLPNRKEDSNGGC